MMIQYTHKLCWSKSWKFLAHREELFEDCNSSGIWPKAQALHVHDHYLTATWRNFHNPKHPKLNLQVCTGACFHLLTIRMHFAYLCMVLPFNQTQVTQICRAPPPVASLASPNALKTLASARPESPEIGSIPTNWFGRWWYLLRKKRNRRKSTRKVTQNNWHRRREIPQKRAIFLRSIDGTDAGN